MKLTIFIFVVLSLFSFGQAFSQIEWGPLEKMKGYTSKLLPTSNENFYTLIHQGGSFGSFYLSRYDGFQLIATKRIKPVVNQSAAVIQEVFIIGNQPYVFLSDRIKDKEVLYAQAFDEKCEIKGEPIKLSEFVYTTNGLTSKGQFQVLFSKNSSFFCVEYTIPASKKENEKIGYKIFSSDFELVKQGEYQLPYFKDEAQISERFLSDKGDYFISVKLFDQDVKKSFFRDNSKLKEIIIKHIGSEENSSYTLNFDGKLITELKMSSDSQNNIALIGLYTDKEKQLDGTKGVFSATIDLTKKTIVHTGFQEFSKDFITQDWTKRQLERSERQEEKGKGSPELTGFDIREIYSLKDGTVVGVLEQYVLQSVTYVDPRGFTRTMNYYNYNDLIVFKLSQEGQFNWLKRIPKNQTSVNDYGYLSSVFCYLDTKNNLNIFFNDHYLNYNQDLSYNNRNLTTDYMRRSTTLAQLKLDLNSGEYSRQSVLELTKDNLSGYTMPKNYAINYSSKTMLMYMNYRKKRQFGIIKF